LFATRNISSGEYICPYAGERLSQQCLDSRYPGDITAPYTVAVQASYIDSACVRGIASMSNGLFKSNGTSRAARYHNCEIVERTPGQPWLRATKDIACNSELLTYYGEEFKIEQTHVTKRMSANDTQPC